MEKTQLLKDFKRDGYLALPNFLENEEIAEVQQEMKRFIRNALSNLPREHVFYEVLGQPDSLKQIQQLQSHDSFFAGLFFAIN